IITYTTLFRSSGPFLKIESKSFLPFYRTSRIETNKMIKGADRMVQTVYTTYWQSRIGNVKKEHGTYKTEEEAIKGIHAWWELHKETYPEAQYNRTNSGALEIVYEDEISVYRIEKRTIDGSLPSRSYKLKKPGEIDALRKKHNLDDELCVFDELAEPFRDRLILAMADSKKARNYIYDREGRPIRKMDELNRR